jgi:hypothetical protein
MRRSMHAIRKPLKESDKRKRQLAGWSKRIEFGRGRGESAGVGRRGIERVWAKEMATSKMV